MPQKTNLNVSPYYDDFNKDDNFYRVLFKPGYPVQARELTGLQSILQNQIESFGSHIFKEGSMVIPGGITCDNNFTTVKVLNNHLGIDITVYLDSLVSANNGRGALVSGQSSDVVGRIKGYLLPPAEGVSDITLFVKYRDGGSDNETVEFQDGEVLLLQENVTYGNTTLNSGDSVITLTSTGATSIGYSVGVAKGVYFIRGTFIDVPTSSIVLDPYTTDVSYRVGFDILEQVVTADEDGSLNDNAKGFTNYAAPGADRLKITVKLTKKQLQDYEDVNFVELVRIDKGEIKSIQDSSTYSVIKDYFAKRTFDESGSYAVDAFKVDIAETLNDETGNGGLYRSDELTEQGNVPTEDLMSIRLSAGTAYVRGYDIDLESSVVVDVEKPRTTKKVNSALIPFAMGGLLKVHNVRGTPYINIGAPISGNNDNTIELYNRVRNSGNSASIGNSAKKIGEARVYWYGVSDAPYTGATTQWDLYLYDIQTFTTIYLANAFPAADVPLTSYVRGVSSGATGYIHETVNNVGGYNLVQTSGTFLVGEKIIINENERFQTSLIAVNEYNVEDIKSVYQNSDALNTDLGSDFIADTVLHEKILPNFSALDKLTISGGNTGAVSGKFFNAVTGIKTEAIIKYQTGTADPNFNIITGIAANGTSITLSSGSPSSVSGIYRNNVDNGDSQFSLMVPKIKNSLNSGLYADLPRANIASVDLASSNLTISKQITGQSTDAVGTLTITSTDALDTSAGITSAFFETFDAERYGVFYADGTIEQLTSDQFVLGNNGNSITLNNLTPNQSSNVTVSVTLKKQQVTNKIKDFVKSKQLLIRRTAGISTATGLSTSPYYGLRVEDKEISLNTADVVKVRAVYESTNNTAPVLDRLTFSTGLSLDVNAIVGEKIVGKNSRAIGQVVNRTATTIDYVPLNENTFEVDEFVDFKDSSINAAVQEIRLGSYVDRTSNYYLDKGQRNQYLDYSRIVRVAGNAAPARRLLVIFDGYETAAGGSGDIYTVNSYTQERYKSDIPKFPTGERASDSLDFRPRVQDFDPDTTNGSPFAFSSRDYDSTYRYVVKPDETSLVGYSHYLPRVDLVTLNRLGEVEVIKGEPGDGAQAPVLADDAMEIAQINYPPYVYNTRTGPKIALRDNRRFTMRDIANLEDRIENLEEATSLSLLELSAQSFDATDANGLNRFKSGFIVSNFTDKSLFEPKYTTVDIDKTNNFAVSPVDFWSLPAELALDPSIDRTTSDVTQNLRLLDPNIQKTGDILTLKYDEVDWLEQPHATTVENVNPFNVIVYVGGVTLDPAADNWTRTIYIDDQRTETTGANWVQKATVNVDVNVVKGTKYVRRAGRGERRKVTTRTTTTTTTTTYQPKLVGPSREFDYVESLKISSSVDPFMRSRNVYFKADGLRPFTKHYHFLDSQQIDTAPKVVKIAMSSGTFTVFEDVDVFSGNKKIGHMRIQRPNHKFGDSTRPEITANLGSPSEYVEAYTVDPYDKDAPAPSTSYSATSKLLNIDVRALANQEEYYGYLTRGARIVGRTSGAVATVERSELISDNWGDIIAAFFFRDPNTTPQPPTKVTSGTKTVKLTALPPGVTPTPGSNAFQSEAFGTYSGSGTIRTQITKRVAVRNPPRPKPKPTTVTKAVHRDPLAQTFTVDSKGAMLTSFDLFFASKDPNAKIFVELRTVELGTPTQFLVQDYCQVALNPDQINVSDDASVATNVKFSSPVYLEPGIEYAIVILCPSSDGYEMWTALMGEKTVKTANLPNVQNVIVTKQYIGGALFKSQNGTIWTPNQYQDLTFKLYKAKFVNSGTLTFYNTPVTSGGTNVARLQNNPIEVLPRRLKVPIAGALDAAVVPGVKVGEGTSPSITGFVENLGGPIVTKSISQVGAGYSNGVFANVPLYNISGNGSGAQATVTFAGTTISTISITATGEGYVPGDILGITTANVASGVGGQVSVQTIGATNALYLTNVQGENFTNTETIQYYTDPDDETSRTSATSTVNGNSSLVDDMFSGNVMRIKQYNHAHHGGNNKVEIVDVQPDRERVQLTAEFGINDTSVSVANTSVFATYEGLTTSRGYALIQNEVVFYTNIVQGSNGAGTLTIGSRGLNGSVSVSHARDTEIQPYEVAGVSLMRLNRSHDLPSTFYRSENSNLDNYFLEFDRTLPTPIARDSDEGFLNFNSRKGLGGNTVGISQNHQFSSIEPLFNVITPGKGTAVQALIRTVSGTSGGGTETSFIDQGYEPIALNRVLQLNTPRLVASEINETARLTTLPLNKSLTMRVNFTTEDENLSPMMDIQNSTFILGRNKTNAPIDNYVSDGRSNAIDGDPHASVFVTEGISLEQPATSLKVFIAANRQEDADFRVFYKLFKADSSEIPQSFVPFPGYNNLKDTDGDGYGDEIISLGANDGRPDAFVTPDTISSFSEYRFTADNLEQFEAFAIKVVSSSRNESTPVKFKDIRIIALA